MRSLFFAIAIVLVACGGQQPPLVATDVEVTQPMPGRSMSAGFLVLTNNTAEDIRITGVSSPQYGAVEMHETTMDDGVSRMRKLDELVVPAQGSVTLERGGKHLMLMRAEELQESVTLELMTDGIPMLTISYSFPVGAD